MRTSVRTAIRRGWSRCCPHCGRGALFAGWGQHLTKCDSCGLVYERNPGDTWAFTIIGDRIPIAILVAAIYLGVARRNLTLGFALIFVMCIVIIWTAPRRWGIGIALHYLSRAAFPDASDPIPGDP